MLVAFLHVAYVYTKIDYIGNIIVLEKCSYFYLRSRRYMNIVELSINEIKPYEKNPRKNDKSVNKVANREKLVVI